MRAKRVDATHREIVDTLRRLGWDVFDTSAVGRGFPDAVCCRRGLTSNNVRLVEFKTAKGKLNPAQIAFHERFHVTVLRSIEDAITFF